MKTVKEVAALSGISVRTLHYYDEIGLLPPTRVTEAGYRLYDDRALALLQQILFFRELDFPLQDIRAILGDPGYDQTQALRRQRELLLLKRGRLDRLIALVESNLKGESSMAFEAFGAAELETARTQYADEARRRWGGTAAYEESQKRTARYQKEDWNRISGEMEEIARALASVMESGPDSPAAQELVGRWQRYITDNFYPCTKEILAGLGEMYTEDDRFTRSIDRYADGLARFLRDAIRFYCRS
jgi:DNA-binding transcriptional MerR regulator